jgi:alkylation response protein AidB-like acyl-CoA dehydrogenase
MDLNLFGSHAALREELRDFVAAFGRKSPRNVDFRNRPGKEVLDWQKILVEHGYVGRNVPVEFGGAGKPRDVMESHIIAEAFASAEIYPGLPSQGVSLLVPTLLIVGTEEQKRAYVSATLRGDLVWCQGYSEPGNGSDLANVQTRGELRDGYWVINGQKTWTSSAHYAQMMFLLCRTEPQQPKHKGLSYLLVPMDSPGIEVRPLKTMTGRSEFNEVFFTDVKVPEYSIVGNRGEGWDVANVTLEHERSLIGDTRKLITRLDKLIKLLNTTEADGEPLIHRGEFRTRLLRLQGEVLAWKFHHLRLLTEAAQGTDSGVKRLIVKYGGSVLASRLSELAIDALGSAGLQFDLTDATSEATTWYIDHMYDIGLMIGGGSTNIQKNIISERGLNLPREPRAANASQTGRS